MRDLIVGAFLFPVWNETGTEFFEVTESFKAHPITLLEVIWTNDGYV